MSVEDEKTHKCYKCGQRFKNGQSKYHDFYCQKYSHEEFLKLMNEYPAKEYTEEEKSKLGLIPKQRGSIWRSDEPRPDFDAYAACTDALYKDMLAGKPEKVGPIMFQTEASKIPEIILALESGLEYAQEMLIHHDTSFGRTTRSNKRQAEFIEEDIEKIKAAIKQLKIC